MITTCLSDYRQFCTCCLQLTFHEWPLCCLQQAHCSLKSVCPLSSSKSTLALPGIATNSALSSGEFYCSVARLWLIDSKWKGHKLASALSLWDSITHLPAVLEASEPSTAETMSRVSSSCQANLLLRNQSIAITPTQRHGFHWCDRHHIEARGSVCCV